MPLTPSGNKVLSSMQSTYGADKGERVFYASINKGKPGSQKWEGPKGMATPKPAAVPRSLSRR
jgi:hypothetical protein